MKSKQKLKYQRMKVLRGVAKKTRIGREWNENVKQTCKTDNMRTKRVKEEHSLNNILPKWI